MPGILILSILYANRKTLSYYIIKFFIHSLIKRFLWSLCWFLTSLVWNFILSSSPCLHYISSFISLRRTSSQAGGLAFTFLFVLVYIIRDSWILRICLTKKVNKTCLTCWCSLTGRQEVKTKPMLPPALDLIKNRYSGSVCFTYKRKRPECDSK